MQADTFLGRVKERTGLSTREEALRATRATLETLAERIQCGEARDLSAQLPVEFADAMECSMEHRPERFGADELFERVSKREGVDIETSKDHVRAVIHVLYEAVAPEELDDVRAQLPRDIDHLFGEVRTSMGA